jgi:PPOX class probable F420-dependent enzyme
VTEAVRAAARFDRGMVSFDAGLLAAIPVVAVLGGGIALGDPVAGVTMAAGAMLVGIAWRTTGGRPPLALMATDAFVMALSTFVGCVSGSVSWLHIGVLFLWALMGGLLVGVGNRGGVVGTQAIIAVVVFGRFSEPVLPALGLAALVLTGGLAQVFFLSVIRWPPPLRAQRAATAAAYRALAKVAAASDEASTLPAAAALDEAEVRLASATMFGDAALMTLRSLVAEGYRLRVQLMSIHTVLRQHEAADETADGTVRAAARRALTLSSSALEAAAASIQGDAAAATRLRELVSEFTTEVKAHGEAAAGAPSAGAPARAALVHGARRLSALAGQLRAISSLAPAAGQGGGLRSRRPFGRTSQPRERLRADLAQLRANMSLDSPAGRHALRLAVIVPVAAVIARRLPLQHSYWVPVAAATVLRPEFGATFTRGTERALGTCLGVALAGAIIVVLHPAGAVTVVLVGALAWAGYSVFPASFAVGFGFITALVVFLLNAVSPDTLATASARLLDTLVGGSLGLLAYALWPTWSQVPAWQSLADLLGTERAYVDGVLGAVVSGEQADEPEMRTLTRRARLARTTAESTVARSLSEPSTRRIDADQSQEALGAMRRLIQAAHVLRLDAQEDRHRLPLPGLQALRSDIDDLLGVVQATLWARPEKLADARTLPDLRAGYLAFERACGQDREALALLAELDEIVDAANGLAVISGVEAVDADRENVVMTTFPESHQDLLDARFATLATIGGGGFPQLTEVWFLHDDGELKLSLNTSRLKTRNLRRHPQCSLFVLDLENPYRYLEVRGTARIEPDDDYAFARKVGAKYDADLKVHDNPGEGRVVVTVVPANVYAVDMGG